MSVGPTPAPAPVHPILQELIAALGPILAQLLASILAKYSPAQIAEMHKRCCEAAAKP